MIRSLVVFAANLASVAVADADTISVTPAIPNAHGLILHPHGGAVTPFTAPSITLTAMADTQDLVTIPQVPPLYKLNVPLYFSIPGYPIATFYDSVSGVAAQDIG